MSDPDEDPVRWFELDPSDQAASSFLEDERTDHPVREQILDLVGDRPGLNKHQVAQALGLHDNVVEHHLGRLTQAGAVVLRDASRERETLVFRTEDADLWDDERTRILFGRAAKRNIALYLADHSGAMTQEIAEALGLSPVTIRHHLRVLREHDLVQRHRAGRTFRYEPGEVLDAWIERAGDGFPRTWEPSPGP